MHNLLLYYTNDDDMFLCAYVAEVFRVYVYVAN